MKYAVKISTGGAALLVLTALASSCVSIPERVYVVSRHGEGAVVTGEAECREEDYGFTLPGGRQGGGIDPDGFTLFNWNVMKGGIEGWEKDFVRLSGGANLLTLQEASLTETLRSLLGDSSLHWDLAAAFLRGSRETGVLTGSTSVPASRCVTRYAEPLVMIPKTVMVTRYPLTGTGRFLLVANVHLINYTVDTGEYQAQLRDLENILAAHDGPILLAGDFNTWSGGRTEVVAELIGRLGLSKVAFQEEDLASVFGRPVDHVLYRGLEKVSARAVPVATSDHNPVIVKFRAANRPGI